MWLILSDATDAAAAWTAVGLRRLGLDPVVLLGVEELLIGVEVVHRVSRDGTAWTRLTLHDGRVLRSGEIRGVVNRLASLPAAAVGHLGEASRPYALEEWDAASTSWLAGLPCPVLNPPVPGAPSGLWRRVQRWQRLARSAGLPSPTWSPDSSPAGTAMVPQSGGRDVGEAGGESVRVLVAGSRVVNAPAPHMVDPLVQMAQMAGTPLIEVEFVPTESGYVLGWVSLLPYLPAFGDEGLRALAATLKGAVT